MVVCLFYLLCLQLLPQGAADVVAPCRTRRSFITQFPLSLRDVLGRWPTGFT